MSKLRLGVIGLGSVVREIYESLYYASAYSDSISIEAVAEPIDELRAAFCSRHGIPSDRQFSDYGPMLDQCDLDAVHVNTPDSLHEAPTIAALERGLDVLLPKPLAESIGAAHRMRAAAKRHERLIGVDFHKRGDPRIIEAAHRYRSGRYGQFQYADWHMIDRLLVADPNHEPPFFATPDFAEKNSPISFLTVHMADSFMQVVGLRPTHVRTVGWSQKLPSLRPRPVNGFDMCDTEVVFENGGVAHFVTGWHWPNHAPAMSNQWTRTICTDGVIDMIHTDGLREITHDGVGDPHVLFQATDARGMVSGFGMSVPGDLLQQFIQRRDGHLMPDEVQRLLQPTPIGFWSTVIVDAALESLRKAERSSNGVTFGVPVDIDELLRRELGAGAAEYLQHAP